MEALPHELHFDDPIPKEVPVTIGSKKYVLCEATVEASKEFRNAGFAAARMVDGKIVGLNGLANAEPVLVSRCLYELYDSDGETKRRPVAMAEINRWPDRISSKLFDAIKMMSPALVEESAEALQKRRDAIDEKLKALHNGEDRDSPKAWQPDGTTVSA